MIAVVNVLSVLAADAWLPTRWVVVGMAGGYSVSYLVGLVVSVSVLRGRIGGIDGRRIARTWARLLLATPLSAVVGFLVARAAPDVLGKGP